MKRLMIYFFYDQDGVVDNYIPFLLEKIKPFCDEICFVVNGYINKLGKEKINKYINKLLIRDNIGMDAKAYQHAIHYYGFQEIAKYDELLIMNFTFYGPIFSIQKLFNDMEAKKCDFWGIYKWPIHNSIKYTHHIPSFFIAYRKSVLQDICFKEYWENLGDTSTYEKSCSNHEQYQLNFYESKGFISAAWIDNTKYKKFFSKHWPLFCADKVCIDDYCPFIKRRVFFEHNFDFPFIDSILNLIKYIKSSTDYDIDMIFQNLKRTQTYHINSKIKFQILLSLFLNILLFRKTNIIKELTKLKKYKKVKLFLEFFK